MFFFSPRKDRSPARLTYNKARLFRFGGKRLFEHTGCHQDYFPMNAKRAKRHTIIPKNSPKLECFDPAEPTSENIQLNSLPNPKKYPPPKIRKGIIIVRDFPSVIRDQSYSSLSESDVVEIQTPEKESNDWCIVSFDDHQSMIVRLKVRQALNLFTELHKILLNQKNTIPKQGVKGVIASKSAFEAAMLLKSHDQWVNNGSRSIGFIPGVVSGDCFQYRAELVIVGLHGQVTSDIDYIHKDGNIYATSIVISGGGANVNEPEDSLVYSCAYPKKDSKDLIGGTLALKNSMNGRTPVRVIRGYTSRKKTSTNKRQKQTYVYNGIYVVTKILQEKVLKFQLTRMSDQQHKYRIPNHCIVEDISQGQENIPIRAINDIDDEKPPNFTYISKMVYPMLTKPVTPRNCDCLSGCSDLVKCSCVVKNGGEVPFNDIGCIVRAKSIINECGPLCKCPPSCENRVSQRGIQYELEVFKTHERGWGLRSRNLIPSGGFVCEYIGEILGDIEADDRASKDEYLFDIGNNFNTLRCRKDNDFAIDAAHFGNMGRFVNHSCSPNMYAQNVFYDHDDERLPHIMFFATKNIKPFQELTYDYNYNIDQVKDANGNIKRKDCYCGARCCTGRLY